MDDLEAMRELIDDLRASKTVRHIFLLVTRPVADAAPEDCSFLQTDDLSSSDTVAKIAEKRRERLCTREQEDHAR